MGLRGLPRAPEVGGHLPSAGEFCPRRVDRQVGRGVLQDDGCTRWESWLCSLLAEKLSTAEAAWREGFCYFVYRCVYP